MKKNISVFLLFMAVSVFACSETTDPVDSPMAKVPFTNLSNTIVLDWNRIALETMKEPTYDPMVGSRIFAMVHLAMHDALNSIAPVYETYALIEFDKKADPIAALSSAAYTVLVGSFPGKKEQLDAALANAISGIKSDEAKQRGLALGALAGQAILALRAEDGAFQNPITPINNPQEPGLYQPVPPTPFLYAPFWATLKPFGLQTPQQFRVKPMPALGSPEYATAYDEVKSKGAKLNHSRTAEETTIAKFWYEFSEIGWNRVTATAAADANLNLVATTRLFALVNMAMADSYIAGWDSKFHYNFWRPYTAIHAAATDGNANTSADVSWESLMNTPPVQDYPSTHSTLGNAAATVLNNVIGENIGFTMTSTSAEPENPSRTLKNFTIAAEENATSRVLAGLHFRFSCDSGLKLGKDVGQWVLENHLRPKAPKTSL